MKLENQVCTLEQGKKLRELGIEMNSYFLFGESSDFAAPFEAWIVDGNEDVFYPAFTVAELGVMLPDGYDTMRVSTDNGDRWRAYDDSGKDAIDEDSLFDTEVQARAAMIIHLLNLPNIKCTVCFGHGTWQGGLNCPHCGGSGMMPAQSIITVEEVNARLSAS